MSDITIRIEIQNQNLAKEMVAKFFAEKGVRSTSDAFDSPKWAGMYRMADENNLEITITRRPWWAKQAVIEPEIKKFFLGI